MALPAEVYALAEMSPVEDIAIALLRSRLGGVPVKSLIDHDQQFPLVLVRRGDSFGIGTSGDERFVDDAVLIVHTFCIDPDGDEDAALLAEAVRVVLRDAWLDQTKVPGRGHITHFEVLSRPRRAPDWATATGPVQYADLPTGAHRYETRFQIRVRRPKALALP